MIREGKLGSTSLFPPSQLPEILPVEVHLLAPQCCLSLGAPYKNALTLKRGKTLSY